jgi:NADP-dependent 3-hydroxy acid dehydrogenase YdfG
MSEHNPVFLITGASSGIGAASARLLAAEGWRLVLAARSIDKLDALAEELGGPDHAVAVECDVTEWADQQAAVTVALEHYGGLDAAWANAGFGGQRSFLADTIDHWRDMVLANVYGAALTIRAAGGAAPGRRHRPGCPVRAVAAAARGRERDPRAADGPAALTSGARRQAPDAI